MSKKTRKKSSKAPPGKSGRTSAAKPSAAQTARGSKASVKKPAEGGRQGGSQGSWQETSPSAQSRFGQSVSQGPIEIVKIQSIGAAQGSSPRAAQPLKASRPPVPETGLAVEGAKAPAFQLPRDGGDSVSLADYAGKKLVLFFYPRADTPGCTREAIDFTRLSDAFADEGAAVLGISADSVKAQESFRDKHRLSVPLISDEKHEMLEAYGAWGEKSMYGRSFMGIIRTTVLIAADGRIAKIWRNVRVDGHADEVLAAVREG